MKTVALTYIENLIARYWDYQRAFFPEPKNHFALLHDPMRPPRPPVFHRYMAGENVIARPGATEEEISQLLNLIPPGERHKWFGSMNSSQALAQSVLGNLAVHDLLGTLNNLSDDAGLPLLSEAQASLENFRMEFKVDWLGEPRSTRLDAYVGGDYRIAIECKFTESEVGTCSRPRIGPKASNYVREYCNGTYTQQQARAERCSLTEVGVLYWRYIPGLFKWESTSDMSPCPLCANYQLVRNILAICVGRDGLVSPANGHVLLIYDARNEAFQEGGNGHNAFMETRQALLRPAMLRKCSWQRLVQHLRENDILPWLTEELALKYGF
jgi:hypothetical protein